MAVAERLYLHDPITSFWAVVTDIREYARKDGVQLWQIALDRTAFYPTSGGQPHDIGVLKATSRSGAELTVAVDDVMEDDAGEVWHSTVKPLLTGTAVEGTIDSARRFDHMQQHTGQHLLSAVLADRYGARTVSFHMGEVDCTIDLALDTRVTQASLVGQLPEIELHVNGHIASDLPVSVRTIPNEEARTMLAGGLLRKLPPREGDIRLVTIGELDRNACGGTHVGRLGEIGMVLLRETERVKGGLRLHFRCGLRAVAAARQDWETLAKAAAALSIAGSRVADAVLRLQTEARSLVKERQSLREELAESHAVQLAVEERIEHGLRLVYRVFTNRDVDYVKLLASKLLAAVPHTAAVLVSKSADHATVVIASNVASGSGTTLGCSALLRDVLAPYKLRGGGTAALAQAQVPLTLLEPITEALKGRLSGQ